MTRSQKTLAGFFGFMGTMHFVIPRSFEAIMPPSLPRHREANRIPRWALWARLPLQPLAMFWVWRATRD